MLYVVIVAVDNTHNTAWFRWMRDEHIAAVLATGCFDDATFVRDADADTESQTAYRIIYRAHSDVAFEHYQREFGDALRAEHVTLFGDVTQARRELLPVLIHLDAPTE